MIEILQLSKIYNDKSEKTEALKGVDLSFGDRSLNVVFGKSGSGKTTLLKLIGLMDTPTGGTVEIDAVNYFELSDKERAAARNGLFGFVFQHYNLEPKFSVYENVELPLIIADVPKKERKAMIEAALDKVGFRGREKSLPTALSGGQQQRVAIARALVRDPKIILADEPCGNLDAENGRLIYDLLSDFKKEKTVVIVSHDPEAIENKDLLVKLADGEVESVERF